MTSDLEFWVDLRTDGHVDEDCGSSTGMFMVLLEAVHWDGR